MAKVIMAVFDNDRAAHAAAESLRQSPDGIFNLNVASSAKATHYASGVFNSVAPLGGDYTQMYTPDFHSCVGYSQMQLRVSCKDELEQDVVSRLTAAGAEKITVR